MKGSLSITLLALGSLASAATTTYHLNPTKPTKTALPDACSSTTVPPPENTGQPGVLPCVFGNTGDLYNIQLGHISKQTNAWGEYSVLTNDSSDYLEAYVADAYTATSPYTYNITNPPLSCLPYLGAVLGTGSNSSILGPGYFNYAWIVAITDYFDYESSYYKLNSFEVATGVDTQPIQNYAISYDYATGETYANWFNPPNTVEPQDAELQFVYSPSKKYLVMTGDPDLWADHFDVPDAGIVTLVPC